MVFTELTLFDLGVELIVSQDLEDLPDVLGMRSVLCAVDDDVVQEAYCGKVELFP